MDITQFNKELGKRIAIAKTYEIKGDIQAAIQQWVEISEMTLNFSKSPKIDPMFKNMIINRTRGIFIHIKELKAGQLKEEVYKDDLKYLEEEPKPEISQEMVLSEDTIRQEELVNQDSDLNPPVNKESKIIEDSEFKELPKGFKEIQPSEDFTIITPHDENFVKKQRAIAEESEMSKTKKQKASEEDPKPVAKVDLICFACGYDKNARNDKVCKNCGTKLN